MTGLYDWMIDTFVYTGLLIGAVLVLRRPVARHFGPQIAYALWALPLLRFVMPPIVLPAWMAPTEQAQVVPSNAEPLVILLSDGPTSVASGAPEAGVDAMMLLLPLWLGGAIFLLAKRIRDYRNMRRDLLAKARPMGEAGKVRLVETPAVSAPVAFGIRDKVVALPVGFMALLDRNARDMAIAHELEHHRGHDLLANIAAQPLLALHWFNPLAWWGWRAMRRDQEAACDARVVAGKARPEKAAYAEVIAGFAAGEHLALAAPMASAMACPVLGEKSIIHRLRSLTMNDISTRRRRFGIAVLTTTALALPLTASISYAAAEEISPPAGAMPDAAPLQDVDPDVVIEEEQDSDPQERTVTRTYLNEDGERRVIRVMQDRDDDGRWSEAEHAELMAEIEEEMAELDRELGELDGETRRSIELALAESRNAVEDARRVVVLQRGFADEMQCNGQDVVVERELSDGRRAMMICRSGIDSAAIDGLRAALESIRYDRNIPEEARREAIRGIEQAIEEMEAARHELRRISFNVSPKQRAAPHSISDAQANRTVTFVSPVTGRPLVVDKRLDGTGDGRAESERAPTVASVGAVIRVTL